jgi:hypothetical protein
MPPLASDVPVAMLLLLIVASATSHVTLSVDKPKSHTDAKTLWPLKLTTRTSTTVPQRFGSVTHVSVGITHSAHSVDKSKKLVASQRS